MATPITLLNKGRPLTCHPTARAHVAVYRPGNQPRGRASGGSVSLEGHPYARSPRCLENGEAGRSDDFGSESDNCEHGVDGGGGLMTTCMFVRGDRGVCFHGEEVVRMVHFHAIQT